VQSALVWVRFLRVSAAKNIDYSHLDEFFAVPDGVYSLMLGDDVGRVRDL
jgi:hypothetical protein